MRTRQNTIKQAGLNEEKSNPKQAVLPMLIQDYLDICEPVLTFDRFMGEIELEDQCKVNLRFMYLMDHQAPSYRTFGYMGNDQLLPAYNV